MDKIFFYSVTEPYGEFSNFAQYPIKLKGKLWPTSEHYFQAQKFMSEEYREKIRKSNTPFLAARLGRSRKVKIRHDWEKIKDKKMFEAVKAKFEQHEDLRDLLLSTGDAQIVEHTINDNYWGDAGDGTGKNKLGKILMRLRNYFESNIKKL